MAKKFVCPSRRTVTVTLVDQRVDPHLDPEAEVDPEAEADLIHDPDLVADKKSISSICRS